MSWQVLTRWGQTGGAGMCIVVRELQRGGVGVGHWTQPVDTWGQWTLTMPGHYAVILPRFSGKTE